MWQSRAHYSIANFNHFTAFKALYILLNFRYGWGSYAPRSSCNIRSNYMSYTCTCMSPTLTRSRFKYIAGGAFHPSLNWKLCASPWDFNLNIAYYMPPQKCLPTCFYPPLGIFLNEPLYSTFNTAGQSKYITNNVRLNIPGDHLVGPLNGCTLQLKDGVHWLHVLCVYHQMVHYVRCTS